MSAEILIVDDEEDIRGLIRGILEDENYTTREAGTAKGAVKVAQEKCPDLVILDIWLQGSDKDGLGVLEDLKALYPDLPVLMISGHGTVETAVSSIKKGAYDFIEKPFKSDRLLLMISRALETANLKKENKSLKETPVDPVLNIIGSSSAIQNLRQAIEQAGARSGRVLISGETGTGKSMAARLIHEVSVRAGQPYIMLNGIDPLDKAALLEGFKKAGNGSLVINHIECLDNKMQAALCSILQEEKLPARLISIADSAIEQKAQNGLFRQDLLSRISVQRIVTPSLKSRQADIGELANHFAEKIAKNSGFQVCRFSDDAVLALQKKEWPGNAGAFKNYIELCCIALAGRKQIIQAADLPVLILDPGADNPSSYTGERGLFDLDESLLTKPLREAREAFERAYLAAQIERFEGSVSETAKSIGMERSALHRKLKSLDISAVGPQDREDGEDSSPVQKRA